MSRARGVGWTVEAALAALFAIGAVLTAIFPQWIEALGFEPDAANGSAEWAIVIVLGVAALVSAVFSRRHYLSSRQLRIEKGSRL